MKVISNSSPLIFLSAVRLLDILRIEFGEVLIPEMVYQEVTANDLKGSDEVKGAGGIKVVPIGNRESLFLLPSLDAGEREAIILASEQNADLLLVDDLAGRRAAMMYGINVMGTLGFLKVMYRKGRIENLQDVLDDLREHGFRMDANLYRTILEEYRSR